MVVGWIAGFHPGTSVSTTGTGTNLFHTTFIILRHCLQFKLGIHPVRTVHIKFVAWDSNYTVTGAKYSIFKVNTNALHIIRLDVWMVDI